jgi:hypothetical protein
MSGIMPGPFVGLVSRVRNTQAVLHFSEAIDVTGKACLEMASHGINVGGEYHSVRASTWNFSVEFWPDDHRPMQQ